MNRDTDIFHDQSFIGSLNVKPLLYIVPACASREILYASVRQESSQINVDNEYDWLETDDQVSLGILPYCRVILLILVL